MLRIACCVGPLDQASFPPASQQLGRGWAQGSCTEYRLPAVQAASIVSQAEEGGAVRPACGEGGWDLLNRRRLLSGNRQCGLFVRSLVC